MRVKPDMEVEEIPDAVVIPSISMLSVLPGGGKTLDTGLHTA